MDKEAVVFIHTHTHTHTHTCVCVRVCVCNGILLSHKKEWNIAVCSTMERPRDYHSKWSKSEKDKYHMISFICGVLKSDTNELIYKIETHRHRKQTYDYQRQKGGGRDELGIWD